MTTPSDTGDLNLVDWRAVSKILGNTPVPQRLPPRQTRATWEAERRELYKRKLAMEMEAIRLYEPVLLGESVHPCLTQWLILDGANRACLAGEQEIYDPATRKLARIDSISSEFHVQSMNPETGKIEIRKASKPFIKAWGGLYRFTFSNGETLCASMEHHAVAADGRWTTLADATDGQRLLCDGQLKSSLDLHVTGSTEANQVSELVGFDVAFRAEDAKRDNVVNVDLFLNRNTATNATRMAISHTSSISSSLPRGTPVFTLSASPVGVVFAGRLMMSKPLVSARIVAKPCQSSTKRKNKVRCSALLANLLDFGTACFGAGATMVDCVEPLTKTSRRASEANSLGIRTRKQPTANNALHDDGSYSWSCHNTSIHHHKDECKADLQFSLSHPVKFDNLSSYSTTSIVHVEYIGQGPIWDISVEPHANYVAGGLINANCKSVTCCGEVAYALTGTHPHGKYVKRNGLAWFVGLKEKHLILMYDNLFHEGAFRVIRDEHTKLWRTMRWDRNDPTRLQDYDEAYKEKSRPAPPFIPERMITTGSMADKAKGIPGVHVLSNGWKIIWSPGGGEPEQGQHWNLVWFDEEMTNPEFYKEAHRGLTKLAFETELTKPRGLWSATSQVANPELAELRMKADKDPESKFVRRFTFLIRDNPYISEADRATFKEGLSEDDVATRYEGIPASTYRCVYSSYNPMGPHGVEPFDIPADWCIWAVTDPGRVRCGTLFDAIDPDQAFHTVYANLQVKHSDAHEWARGMKAHETKMGRRYQGIIFDQMRGRQTLDSLYSQTVAEQYWAALIQAGVTPMTCGNVKGMAGFWPGLSNVEARERALLNMLTVRMDGPFEGTSKFRTFRGAVPQLDKQFGQAQTDPNNSEKRYKHKNIPTEEIECAEYLAAFNPTYSMPEPPAVVPVSRALDDFKKKQKRTAQRELATAGNYY